MKRTAGTLDEKGKKVFSKNAIILLGIGILGFIIVFIWRYGEISNPKDIQNTDNLRLATSIDEMCDEISMSLMDADINQDTKTIVMQLENLSHDNFDIPTNEIIIDRLIGGKWYFWGRCGNGLEGANGIFAKERIQLEYRLDIDEFLDADYIENYVGDFYARDGENKGETGSGDILLFPGEYRIRLKGIFIMEGQENKQKECEVVHQFSV